uniref:Uncharacterized protein n=1 Tax=Alsidium seaforthii TaxID=2007182 RepID=A0A1Z1MCQ8_9FLOR|nr:hypothetical protein [Bryothamnion seaforthii]ARW63877.1 hypothetical protein [Bryothamnion seaforthii]
MLESYINMNKFVLIYKGPFEVFIGACDNCALQGKISYNTL